MNAQNGKNGDFPKETSRLIKNAMEIRQKSDYDDFYIASKAKAEEQIDSAEKIIGYVEGYLNEHKII